MSNSRESQKTVMVAGTFDLLHRSHIEMLRNAANLGDKLIVMLSTDEFNAEKGKKPSYFNYQDRKFMLEAVRYVDLVVPETSWDDKAVYIDMLDVDIFAMGDDWKGKFDSLKEQFPDLKVMYFPRGEYSTSQIKNNLSK
jgi:glycerol-3-phosphate cytidylyltransferase